MRDNIHAALNTVPELIIAQARAEGFRFAQRISYPFEAHVDSLTFDGGVVEWKQTDPRGGAEFIFRFDYGLLQLSLLNEFLIAQAFAVSDEEANALLDLTREQIPPFELNDEVIEVAFWRNTLRGASCIKRKITCLPWHDVKDNYVKTTRAALERLFTNDFDSGSGGKLVLCHGEPGTGKTYALRSWGRTCRDTLDINYILDPDVFFGANADYMLEMLTKAPRNKWSLFVAEDTGELLTKDAKRETGQALSRLLNICDGLIGQELRILVLITTNEDLGVLHPAVVRPGRCYANIGFETFNESEAREWLNSRGIEGVTMPSRSTLAQLYSAVENTQIVAQKPKLVGFVT